MIAAGNLVGSIGQNWQASGPGTANWSSVAASASGNIIAATINNGYIYVSTNSGVSWTARKAVRAADFGLKSLFPPMAPKWRRPLGTSIQAPTAISTLHRIPAQIGPSKAAAAICDGFPLLPRRTAPISWRRSIMAIFMFHRMPARAGRRWAFFAVTRIGLPSLPRRMAPISWRWRTAARFTPRPTPAAHGNSASAVLAAWNSVASSSDGSRLVAALGNAARFTFRPIPERPGRPIPRRAALVFRCFVVGRLPAGGGLWHNHCQRQYLYFNRFRGDLGERQAMRPARNGWASPRQSDGSLLAAVVFGGNIYVSSQAAPRPAPRVICSAPAHRH